MRGKVLLSLGYVNDTTAILIQFCSMMVNLECVFGFVSAVRCIDCEFHWLKHYTSNIFIFFFLMIIFAFVFQWTSRYRILNNHVRATMSVAIVKVNCGAFTSFSCSPFVWGIYFFFLFIFLLMSLQLLLALHRGNHSFSVLVIMITWQRFVHKEMQAKKKCSE